MRHWAARRIDLRIVGLVDRSADRCTKWFGGPFHERDGKCGNRGGGEEGELEGGVEELIGIVEPNK